MTDDPSPDGGGVISELTFEMRGLYRVTTHGSVYEVDLRDPHHRTIIRIPGQNSKPSTNDILRPLRSIEHCQVGDGAYFTMDTFGFSLDIDFFWQQTSDVVRIELLPDDRIAESEHREEG